MPQRGHSAAGMLLTSDAWFRLSNFVMALFFAAASYVQLNDPDAILWIVAYSLPGFASAAEALRAHWWSRRFRLRFTGAAILLSGCLLAASICFWFRDPTCVGLNPVVCEHGRESGGSAVALTWLVLLRYDSAKISQRRAALSAALCLLPLAVWIALLTGDRIKHLCSVEVKGMTA